MTYQFEHDPITDCMNWKTRKKCPMFEFAFDDGYCKLSKKMIYYHYDELPEGVPEWCELVRVKRSIDCIEAPEMAVEALEKQKPKKPHKYRTEGDMSQDVYECSECGTVITLNDTYCKRCGRVQMWED